VPQNVDSIDDTRGVPDILITHCALRRKFKHRGDVTMKKILVALLAVTVFAGSAFAADVMEFKKGVTFKHKAHAEALKDCKKCHENAQGGKIEGFGKDFAHKKCKECHADLKKGPTNCKGCHTK
jgi:hypothetical protein